MFFITQNKMFWHNLFEQILRGLTSLRRFVLYINGQRVVTDVKVNDGYWHFLCVTWENGYGTWRVFVDGILKDSGTRLAQGVVVQANGSLVIGQEQDRLGGGFSESEAFLGKLGLLDIWNVVLDEKNITALWNSCEKYHGNVVAWVQMQQYIHGDVVILASPFCRGCPLPTVPFKGNINVSEDLSEVTYYCDSGYVIRFVGEEHRSLSRRCLKHGQWEGHDTPICTKIRCGFPGYFPRGYIYGRSYSFGDEIYYFCADDYELRGNPHRICNSDGKWTGLSPICIGMTCKNLLAPENGDIEYILEENERDDITILQAGQQLEFKCNPGYLLKGERYLTCLETGIWDYERPSCILYGCPPPKKIKHGYIAFANSDKSNRTSVYNPEENTIDDLSKRTYHYDDVVGFFCHHGYKFRGSYSLLTEFKLQCAANGSWIGFVPDCVPRVCPWPDRMKNARIFLRKQDNITVEIPVERNAMSESIDRITRDNEEEISPEMFVSGVEIVIVCDSGYELIGDKIRMCTNETWSSTFASCVPHNCSIEDHPLFKIFKKLENENDVMSRRISFEFDEKWHGTDNVTGTYKQFEIFVEGKAYGQRIILACQNDTRMNLNKLVTNEIVSNITWTCNEIGIWIVLGLSLKESELERLLNDSTYVCDRSCAPPEIPKYGYIDNINNTDDMNNRKAIDNVVIFKCRHGYVLEGDERSVCLPNVTWSALPSCKPVACGEPPIFANTILKPDISEGTQNFIFGNMISYQCVPGYRIFGQTTLRCLGSGKWSRMNGRCSKISCGKPQIQHGIMLHGRSYLFQDQLTYVCPNGKKQGVITCQADGRWNESPKCNENKGT